MSTTCTICGMQLIGHPDDDVTCADCEQANFTGDLLRYPPQGTRSWWLTARGERARLPRAEAWSEAESSGHFPDVPDGLRALTRADGWRWNPERGDAC